MRQWTLEQVVVTVRDADTDQRYTLDVTECATSGFDRWDDPIVSIDGTDIAEAMDKEDMARGDD